MVGYIGSKASVTQVDGYNQAEADAEFVNDPNGAITVSGSNVGIGTSSPTGLLTLDGGGNTYIALTHSTAMAAGLAVQNRSNGQEGVISYNSSPSNERWEFSLNGTERMRIDSSGDFFVGTTAYTGNTTNTGGGIREGGLVFGSAGSGAAAVFNRLTNDGEIALFRRNGSTVGSIGSDSAPYFYINGGSTRPISLQRDGNNRYIVGNNTFFPAHDNLRDLGSSSYRWDDVYATNGNINTSDRNEKQDIEVLSDAEQRVAVACKGLLRKFRWIDAVAEKGDDARIHFGIIAQDLQDAFTAEGLDAGRYAMFISSTWWETQTEVPAVEAVAEVLDEDGNVVTEAVEAKDAYTRTDTYETLEEAPEGATERTRLGVRYPELLAFIIGAM